MTVSCLNNDYHKRNFEADPYKCFDYVVKKYGWVEDGLRI